MYTKFHSPQCNKSHCPLWNACERTSTQVTLSEYRNEDQAVDIYILGDYADWKSVKKRTPYIGAEGQILKKILKQELPDATWAIGYTVRGWPFNPDTLLNQSYRNYPIGSIPDFQLERARTQPLQTHPRGPEIKMLCSDFWKEDIKRLRPKMIIALGNLTMQALFPREQRNTTTLADETLYYEGIPVRFIQSPYIMLRQPSVRVSWETQFKNILHNRISAYSSDFAPEIKIVETVSQAEELVKQIKSSTDPVAYDTETKNLNKRYGAQLGTMQFNMEPTVSYVVPWIHWESPFSSSDFKQLTELFRTLWTDRVNFPYWVMHNGKFECNITRNTFGTSIYSAQIFDTQSGGFLLDENRSERRATFKYGIYTLKQLALDYLGFDGYKSDVLEARGEGSLIDLPLQKLADYGGLDTALTLLLKDAMIQHAKKQNYMEQFMNLQFYLYSFMTSLFSDVEFNGMPASLQHLRLLISKQSPLLQSLAQIKEDLKQEPAVQRANKIVLNSSNPVQSKITPLAGPPWVFDFAKQNHAQTLFFDVLDLEPLKVGKSGIKSVDTEFQKYYKKDNPLVDKFATWVETRKMFDSFAKQLYEYVDPSGQHEDSKTDCRIRPNFLISTVVTGRVACRNPNLQAIPRADSDVKKAIKNIFQVEKGKVMVQLDYRFNEMFWVTVVARDENMAKKIMSGKLAVDEFRKNPTEENYLKATLYGDIHKQNASSAFKEMIENITKDQRQAAKGISFGILYDSSVRSVAELYRLDYHETEQMFNNFYAEHHWIYDWKMKMKSDAAQYGYVEAPHGRRRRFPIFDMYRDENGLFQEHMVPREMQGIVAESLRQASNAPIQGIASDSGMLGACIFAKAINDNPAYKNWIVCNAVHDSCVFEVPFEELDEALVVAERCFTTDMMDYMNAVWGIDFIVPTQIDFEIGTKWGELKGWDMSLKSLEEIKAGLKERM